MTCVHSAVCFSGAAIYGVSIAVQTAKARTERVASTAESGGGRIGR